MGMLGGGDLVLGQKEFESVGPNIPIAFGNDATVRKVLGQKEVFLSV